MNIISKLFKFDLVWGFPKINFEEDKICETCIKGKQVNSIFSPEDFVSTHKPLLHIDLFGPIKTNSLGRK